MIGENVSLRLRRLSQFRRVPWRLESTPLRNWILQALENGGKGKGVEGHDGAKSEGSVKDIVILGGAQGPAFLRTRKALQK